LVGRQAFSHIVRSGDAAPITPCVLSRGDSHAGLNQQTGGSSVTIIDSHRTGVDAIDYIGDNRIRIRYGIVQIYAADTNRFKRQPPRNSRVTRLS
jgi:hypothetical protein